MKRSQDVLIEHKKENIIKVALNGQGKLQERWPECTSCQPGQKLTDQCNLREQKKAARRLIGARPVCRHLQPPPDLPIHGGLPSNGFFKLKSSATTEAESASPVRRPSKVIESRGQVEQLWKQNTALLERIVGLERLMHGVVTEKIRKLDITGDLEGKVKGLEAEVERLKQFTAYGLVQRVESLEAEVEIRKFHDIALEKLAKENVHLKLKLRAVNWWDHTLCHRQAEQADNARGRNLRVNRQPPARYLE